MALESRELAAQAPPPTHAPADSRDDYCRSRCHRDRLLDHRAHRAVPVLGTRYVTQEDAEMAVTTWRDVEGARRPWAFEQGINDALHQAGKPIENAHVEGFKGRLRECLNQNWFVGCIPEFGRRMPRSWIPQTNGKISYSRFAHRTPSAPPTFLRGRV